MQPRRQAMPVITARLGVLAEARVLAAEMLSILQQNRRWAPGYNLATVPLAALGFVPPWLAALGMSASSLAVVLNALRTAGLNAKANRERRARGPDGNQTKIPSRTREQPRVPDPAFDPVAGRRCWCRFVLGHRPRPVRRPGHAGTHATRRRRSATFPEDRTKSDDKEPKLP